MAEVTLVDLGMGNVRSVLRALERAGARATLTSDAKAIASAERLVVPGQGQFRDGARRMHGELGDALRAALNAGTPFLGICLGLQLLFESSDEAEGEAGLGVIPGCVKRLDGDRMIEGRPRKVPHMGWNQVRSTHSLIPDGGWFYFVHSFHAVPADPKLTVATADYGEPVCAAVARGSLIATQFHPEKSGAAGIELLRRFAHETSWT
jgi:glutamine amidotransferase